ncbi:PAS domain S-box protein [Methylocapsa polymorpha]|uniref:PAS domain S-box protein n=1 Tax=Methylocapsa polymorpha TaxID=3080828 RepID=A0ABZ0HXQ5_9HYPH|nr:PAS domain S-box protein [Methylocapsa sp. RX1]
MNEVRSDEEIRRLMVETIIDCAIFALDMDGRVIHWSAGAERIKGYRAVEILGRPSSLFYSPEDARRGRPEGELLAAAAKNRFETEGWRVRKDGSRFWAHVVITAMRNEAGELRGFVNLTRDLTDQKNAEEALRRSQERFQRVVESTPNAIVMIDRTGRIEMVNTQAEWIFGYPRAELLGQPVEMLMPERFRAHHPGLRTLFFGDPQSRRMGVGRDLYGLRKDGSEFPVEIGLNPIETEDGAMVLSAIVDITDRKQKEDTLRRSQERFQRAVESAPNAIVMINRTGRIEMVNAGAESIFGYSRAELLGQPVEMLMPQRFRAQHPGLRTSFFADPKARPMGAGRDLYGLKKDRSEFPVEIGLNPIETEDGPMILSAIVDITDRKQKEDRIQAALAEKDLLLGEIHHRVKNNLQIVQSLLSLQAAKIEDQSLIEMLRECQNRIHSMGLVHQTLYQSKDFAKVDFGIFLDSLVPALLNSYGVDPARIALSIDAVQALLPIDTAIPCGLIINELITNSIRHAFPQGRRGNIAVELTKDAEGKMALCVTDDGVGIPAGVDLTRATTLGLQLVNVLTDQLGGNCSVHKAHPTRFVLQFAAKG